MIEVKCAICKTNNNTKVLYNANFIPDKIASKIFSARRVTDNIHYRLVKCLKCGLIFSNPILSKGRINKLYKESRFTYTAEAIFLKKTYFDYFSKYVLSKDLDKLKILDIGCGNGFFLEELMWKGAKDVYGVEPSTSSVMKASKDLRDKIKISAFKKGLFPHETFDVICCFHTLDHVANPNEFIQECYNLLKKGGKAFFIVHDTNGLSVKLLGEKSPIFDIEHIYLFNKKNLEQLFLKNKFKNPYVFNVENTYPLSYWIKLFPIPFGFTKNVLKVVNFLNLDNLPISINAGNIGIIARK